MYKKLLGLSVMFLTIGLWAFADNMETITLTTYYPAPYGVYFQLATKRLSVGGLTPADQPTRDGDIGLQGQPGDPGTWANGNAGQVSYSQDTGKLYHYDGINGKWASDSGGSSGSVMYLDCAWSTLILSAGTCTPPSCPGGWSPVATSKKVTGMVAPSQFWYCGNIEQVCVKN